ncbi:transferase hexapeptide repeat family protein [Neisseriaceae bacterium JH1-16]|nr:transferase hexapeptide repeat family protein [Neisseriaceae bacterium JH1-16]
MAKVYALDGVVPVVDPSAFVHPDAVLIGDVIVGPHCYIGPCAVLRGDFGRIRLMSGVNVQDGCVIHSNLDVEVLIDVDGHIGHGAVIHGCRIGHNALVGMNAVVMDDALVGDNAVVAASAFVPKGMRVPAGVLVAGVPARVVRALSEAEIAKKANGTRLYQDLARRSLATMVAVVPLASEAERG